MTQERFHRLLDNPELLATIPYEEMKTLALAYPYAHNLRYLLALKANQDDHPDADRMLTTAAVYSLDRTQLFYLMAVKVPVFQPVAVAAEEAVLELKPIEIVQRELEARAPQTRTSAAEQPVSKELKTASPVPEIIPEAKVKPAEITDHPPGVAPFSTPPLPFAVWMSHFNPPVLEPKAPQATDQPPAPVEVKPVSQITAQELAERSVTENKDVISETLARLLAKQGYREKAIVMYERLRLAFPEKSAYFAAEIEKLKK